MYYVYILYSVTADKYYVGHSSDPWSRLKQHLSNSGDKYTGSYSDWKLEGVFEVSLNKGDADRVEKFIKRQKSRNLIERILGANFVGTGELAQLVRVPHLRSRSCGNGVPSRMRRDRRGSSKIKGLEHVRFKPFFYLHTICILFWHDF
jgi:putative endonuclease